VQLLEQQLPAETNGRAKQRLSILVALLADTTTGPTSVETLAELTQYSAKRLSVSIQSLLKATVDRSIVLATTTQGNTPAYHIPYRNPFYLSSSNANVQTAREAARVLDEVLKDIRRRARGRRGDNAPEQPEQPEQQEALRDAEAEVEIARHRSAQDMEMGMLFDRPNQNEMSTDADGSGEGNQTQSGPLPPAPELHETQEVLKRFREITKKYHEAVLTKKHLDRLQVTDTSAETTQHRSLDNLRRELLSEAHENIQTMVLETSQLMADTLDATLYAVSSPCGVCFDAMRNPQVFPGCGHAFCETCVNRLAWVQIPYSHDIGKECPMCRHPSPPLTLYL
jgi:hypothetical protein